MSAAADDEADEDDAEADEEEADADEERDDEEDAADDDDDDADEDDWPAHPAKHAHAVSAAIATTTSFLNMMTPLL